MGNDLPGTAGVPPASSACGRDARGPRENREPREDHSSRGSREKEPAIPTLALDALPSAPTVSRPCSEWERVFPVGSGHRQVAVASSTGSRRCQRISLATWGHEADTSEKGNNAAKRSAVSTG